ncbi:MAG: ADP-ribosylation factor-like protein [Candidatus Helarchaeota archaeon]
MELKKIAFLGVDNAGKSTILNILSERYSLINNLTPTVKITRHKMENIFGYSLINWDFPGQKSLREKYLKDVSKTLANTDLIIYVIDVRDYRRILESLKFFKLVLSKLREKDSADIPIFVFCHKVDPDIANSEMVISNIEYIKHRINSIIDNNQEIKFFNTTIYDRWTIFFAFSKAFMLLLPEAKEQKIRKVLEDFANQNDFKSVLLMNENNLIINEFSVDSFSSEVINSLALTLNEVYDIAKEKDLGDQVRIELLSGVAILIPIILGNNLRFFLLSFLDSIPPDFEIKGIDQVIERIEAIQDLSEVS